MPLSLADGETKLRERLRVFLEDQFLAYLQRMMQWRNDVYQIEAANAAVTGSNARECLLQCRFPPCPPAPPVLGIRVPTGLGKSHSVLEQLGPFVQEHGGPVYYFVPTHRLAEEQAAKLTPWADALGLQVKVVRGHSQPDPNNPGQKMCLRADDIAGRIPKMSVTQELGILEKMPYFSIYSIFLLCSRNARTTWPPHFRVSNISRGP